MQKPVRRLVVGYDGSELAGRALRAACDLVRPDGAVTIVHVYEVPWQADAYPWFEDFKESCHTVAEEVLEPAKEICGEYPVATNFKIAVGKPAEVLARLAQSEDADFIVVGTRGHSSVAGLLLGSVTQRLLHIASVPVLAVPPATVGK
jgi:nucleotide-binding universal stress UspA family protein